MTMARPTPPGKRTRISVLDAVVVIVVVIGGVLAIIRYNWLAISRLPHSLPNVNSQIVGEWKSTRGPEHLVFRTDKTVSMTIAANLAQDSAAPAAPETGSLAPRDENQTNSGVWRICWIPARVYAAEKRFLRALQREARGANNKPAQVAVPRRAIVPTTPNPRTQGRTAGAAFAQISRADYDQAQTFTRAIRAGAREAERQDADARDIAQDAGALRAMGFPCRDDEDDF
jgi:hypothetical protein